MTTVSRLEVREALRSLDDRGRDHVKSTHVATELGVDDSSTKSIGKRLAQLADQGAVERWSGRNPSNGVTWAIVDPDAGIRADGGQPEHDLNILADAIERVLLADDGYDHQLTAGPYTVRQRALGRSGVTIRQVVVDYAGAKSWIVLPEGLAEMVVETIKDRGADADLEAATEGDR